MYLDQPHPTLTHPAMVTICYNAEKIHLHYNVFLVLQKQRLIGLMYEFNTYHR